MFGKDKEWEYMPVRIRGVNGWGLQWGVEK